MSRVTLTFGDQVIFYLLRAHGITLVLKRVCVCVCVCARARARVCVCGNSESDFYFGMTLNVIYI